MDANPTPPLSSLAWRGFGFAALWLILAGPEPASWLLGLPSVGLAVWVSLQLAPPSPYRITPGGLLSFLLYFLKESLSGGWDVAMRTLSPRLRIAPDNAEYTSSLPSGLPVVIFAACVSLLPGTLTRRFDHKHLSLHVLDAQVVQQQQLQILEQKIAAMLGIPLEKAHV